MPNNDQISSLFWFLIGGLIVFSSISYSIGEINAPSTGFLPFLTGSAICILAVIGFLQATAEKRKGKEWENILRGVRWDKPLITLGALLAYALLLNRLGFVISTTLLVGLLLRIIEPQKWIVVIAVAFLSSSIMYLVFQVWLKTQLPGGPFHF